jgi:hypothetical protein
MFLTNVYAGSRTLTFWEPHEHWLKREGDYHKSKRGLPHLCCKNREPKAASVAASVAAICPCPCSLPLQMFTHRDGGMRQPETKTLTPMHRLRHPETRVLE